MSRLLRIRLTLALFGLLLVAALVGPALSPWSVAALDWDHPAVAPTWSNPKCFTMSPSVKISWSPWDQRSRTR